MAARLPAYVVPLALAAVLVAAIAAAYAVWQDQLTISATITTGTFDVKFDTSQASQTSNEGYTTPVAQISAKVTQDANGDANDQILITIDNAYPGLQVTFDNIQLVNDGTVPAKLTNLQVDCGNAPVSVSVNGIQVGDVIDAGTSKTISVTITVGDDAAQSSSYSCTVTFTFEQAVPASG